MNVRYRVDLSQAERDQLSALLSGGTHASRRLKRAQILLAADAGVSDDDIAASIADSLESTTQLVENSSDQLTPLRSAQNPAAPLRL